MRKWIFITSISLFISCFQKQSNPIVANKIKEDLDQMINDLSHHYVYLEDKNVDLNCIHNYYQAQIKHIKTKEETVLFFEYLLDEFYDSHLILNTNISSSFRLYAPIYASLKNEKVYISSIWQSQIEALDQEIIGAELLKINGIELDKAIQQFPTHCNDKDDPLVREWIINKSLAGRYNQSRILSLKLVNGNLIEFDLDKIVLKQKKELLSSKHIEGIGIIRIHNTLGKNQLIQKFDEAIDALMETEGLILDLRNTVDGGSSYVARAIMSRFIQEPKPYQKHSFLEYYDDFPQVERSWVEYVSPRKKAYTKPVILLVGRWTGSMGEGLAIGFEGLGRAKIMGTEMERLAGEVNGFSLKYQNFGYQLSTAKLFHVNGKPREQYRPPLYVLQTTATTDETLMRAMDLLKK